MNWLNGSALELGAVKVSWVALASALAILVVGLVVTARLTRRIKGKNPTGPGAAWRASLSQIVGYVLRLTIIVAALEAAGVELGNLLAASAVVAVGVGIALQKVAENFVSGIILVAERSIREGDIIEFDGRIAKVRRMGWRATVAQTLDDEELIVPNSLLTQAAVKNLTLSEPIYRLRVGVGVSYTADVAVVDAALFKAAESMEWREQDRPPFVSLTGFGDSSVNFEVGVWTRDVWGVKRGQSLLRRAIWRELKAANVAIPFPQLDVHLSAPLPPPPAASP